MNQVWSKRLVLVAVVGVGAAGAVGLRLAVGADAPTAARRAEIDGAALAGHVARLASPEMAGRRGLGAELAARYIAERFRELTLEPLFGGSYFQEIVVERGTDEKPVRRVIGRNVGAVVRGRDEKLKDEYIVVSAHYDHLGTHLGVVFPGADDNATGVAMLLETARVMQAAKPGPRRSVMLVAFDLEEDWLWGSRYFASHPPVELGRIKTFITADMIGRSLADVVEDYVFVLGSEHAPFLKRQVEGASERNGLKAGFLGTDLIGTRSDYGPFRDRKIPYLFFSTGEHADYHEPTDTAERVEYAKLEKVSRLICRTAERLASADECAVWREEAPPDLEEARVVHEVLARLLEADGRLAIGGLQKSWMRNMQKSLAGMIERGKITAEERRTLVWLAQLMFVGVF